MNHSKTLQPIPKQYNCEEDIQNESNSQLNTLTRVKTWIGNTLAADCEIAHAAAQDAQFQALLLASFDDEPSAIFLLSSRFISLLNQVFDDRSRAEIALDE